MEEKVKLEKVLRQFKLIKKTLYFKQEKKCMKHYLKTLSYFIVMDLQDLGLIGKIMNVNNLQYIDHFIGKNKINKIEY